MGCISPPLLNIDVDHMVLDELHLMLRVSDVLLRNLIWAMIYRDMEEQHSQRPPQFLEEVIKKIRSCGISFRVK